jgi:septal ring factor EnvC (AmiA/AmiB activator)
MATDACVPAARQRAEVEVIHDALARLSSSRDDFEQFIAGLLDQWEDLRQQCALLERERAMLHAQLEAARRHTAELVAGLAGQKRRRGRQETQGGDQLRRLRRLLENMSRRLPPEQHSPPEKR